MSHISYIHLKREENGITLLTLSFCYSSQLEIWKDTNGEIIQKSDFIVVSIEKKPKAQKGCQKLLISCEVPEWHVKDESSL